MKKEKVSFICGVCGCDIPVENGAVEKHQKICTEHLMGKAIAAQHRVYLTAFGVGLLAFCAGFGICWLAFVR